MKIPTQAEIEDILRDEDLNAWLDLWGAEQGPAKPAALKLIAAAIPSPVDRSLRVLDVGCGPGDAGRVIQSRFPEARIDFVDRNEFFVSLCDAVNRRDGVPGQTLVRDLSEPNWRRDLASEYDVVVAVNTVHWFTLAKGAELFVEIFKSLRSGRARVRRVEKGTAKPAQVRRLATLLVASEISNRLRLWLPRCST